MSYDPSQIRTGNMMPDRSTDIVFEDDSLTQQQFSAECDVNVIVRNNLYQPVDPSQLRFADVSEILPYHESINIVQKAQATFMALPAELRARFDNDAANYVDFLANPANLEEATSLGIAPTPSAPAENASEAAPAPSAA